MNKRGSGPWLGYISLALVTDVILGGALLGLSFYLTPTATLYPEDFGTIGGSLFFASGIVFIFHIGQLYIVAVGVVALQQFNGKARSVLLWRLIVFWAYAGVILIVLPVWGGWGAAAILWSGTLSTMASHAIWKGLASQGP